MILKKDRVALAMLFAMLFAVPRAGAAAPDAAERGADWKLTHLQVVDHGQTAYAPEGLMTHGFTLEGAAKTDGGDSFLEGTFRLTLTVFSPSRDIGIQKAGKCYVTGKWNLKNKYANPEIAGIRHSPEILTGNLMAELPFDPSKDSRAWDATVRLPRPGGRGAWSRREGSFHFNGRSEGTLSLSPSERPLRLEETK